MWLTTRERFCIFDYARECISEAFLKAPWKTIRIREQFLGGEARRIVSFFTAILWLIVIISLSRGAITKHAFRKETMMFSRELITRIREGIRTLTLI